MSSILGLINTESFANDRFKTYRRTVFYYYPQGAAPLTGLLSLMKDEETNDPQYYWFEKRKSPQRTTSAAISSTIPWYSTGITVTGGKVTAATIAAADFSTVVGTQYALKTAADPDQTFRIGHLLKMTVKTSAGTDELIAQVNAVNGSSDAIANVVGIIALRAVTTITYNSSSNVGAGLDVVGSAFAEGNVGSSNAIYTQPVYPYNYTQIFRESYEITGTALKTSAKYDDRGIFPDQAKEAMLNHATEMEKGFIWGERTQVGTSATTITRTTGGVMFHLRQWELGTVYGNTAATADTDDTKRIIVNSTGRLGYKTLMGYFERCWRMTNNRTNEKIAFCGSGAMNILTQLFASKVVQMQKPPAGTVYGMDLVQITLPFGTLYLKTHPLFSENPIWRNSLLILEVANMRYRYIPGRDTELLRNRQPNDADYIKHEYLTECGLELRFPESNMYIQNILDFDP